MKKPIPFGKYYLLDRINVGGMAEVFRAKAFGVEGFERIVAVKRILPSIAEDTEFITMFIDEAKIAVQLSHANIAQIFDLGKVGDAYFIALEYVHGKDLRVTFELAKKLGEPLPISLVCYVIMKVCEGLDYAHNKRDANGRDLALVHRDISPQNVLISYDGEVKLIDFGIAKAAGKASKTQTGMLKGKFGYLSPEQIRGKDVDRRSDVFGVGIVLYELLTGERLFASDSDFSTIEKAWNAQIPPPSEHNKKIPKELEDIVLKALAREVTDRFQSAMELHDELGNFLHSRGEPFTRRELTAWMRTHFAAEAEGDPEAVGDLQGVDAPQEIESTNAEATFKPNGESNTVTTQTRESLEETKAPIKSTFLGMPAVVPPADLAAPPFNGGVPRTAPPPPPPPRRGVPAWAPLPGQATPVSPYPTIPSMASSARAVGGSNGRSSVPPPPPRPNVPAQYTPANGVPPGAAMSSLAALEDAPPPGGPMLDMDWDDEDMSTRIYDRPEDMPGGSGAYEQVNAGFEEVGQGSQGQISTYVPPVNGADAQSMYVSPRAYVRSEPPGRSQPPFGSPTPLAAQPPLSPPPTIGSQPPRSARVASVTQPIATQTATEKGRNPLFAALAVAVVGALCFAAYVYLAKSLPGVVQLSTHPVDASVSFDGKPIGSSSPFVVTGVSPGETHVLEVRKSGYHPWSQEVMVQPGQTLTFPVTLEPDGTVAPAATDSNAPIAATPTPASTGGFSIESTPPGATVFLDDTLLPNVTPMRIANLVPRRYSVRVQLANYHEYKTEVDVHSGDDRVLPRIILLPERIRVRITSEPGHADATVVRGGERRALGKTPLDVTLDNNGSPWRLELSRDDFETYKKELAIDQALLAVDAALLKNDARAERSARPSRASEPRPARAPEPRPARVASAAPAVPAAASPDSSGEGTSPSPSPQASAGAGNGTLRINSRPWSQVYVDGKLIGSTPQLNISLSPGPHRVMLLNSVFNVKKNLTVKIVAGKVETQIINLQ